MKSPYKNKYTKEDLMANLFLLGMIALIYLGYLLLTALSEYILVPKTEVVQVKGLYMEFEFNDNICVQNHRSCDGIQRMYIGIGNDNHCYTLNYPGNVLFQETCHERYQQIIDNNCEKDGLSSKKYCAQLLKAIVETGTVKTEARAEFNPVKNQIFNIRDMKSNEMICFDCNAYLK